MKKTEAINPRKSKRVLLSAALAFMLFANVCVQGFVVFAEDGSGNTQTDTQTSDSISNDGSGQAAGAEPGDTDGTGTTATDESGQNGSETSSGTEAPADEPESISTTTISGVPASKSVSVKKSFSFKVSITPANEARSIYLQRYNSSEKAWKTIKTYRPTPADTASFTIYIEPKYRKRAKGKWRLTCPATQGATAYTSKVFTITSTHLTNTSLSAKSAAVYCIEDKKFIFRKKSKTKRAPASTTKIMTAVILVESGKLKRTAYISKRAVRTPWGILFMRIGDRYRNRDLLYAMMLPSSNDAANAVAESVSGSQKRFVKRMNAKARKLGLKKTKFKTSHGLDRKNQYTTAEDMAKLTAYAYKKKAIRKTWLSKKKTIRSKRFLRKHKLRSSDTLLGYSSNFKGGKTGTTNKARYCFSGIYKYKGKTYVTVVLGSSSNAKRWSDTKKLHKYIKKSRTSY